MLHDRSLHEQRRHWVTYHDMKTGGIMGLQPLTKDMPLRITQTDHNRTYTRMFKNSRCILHGWELHPVDQQRFEHNTMLELVLQHMPICLYLRFPGATWVGNEKIGRRHCTHNARIRRMGARQRMDSKNRKAWFYRCFGLQWHCTFVPRLNSRGCNY